MTTLTPNWRFVKTVDTPLSTFKPRWGTTKQDGERGGELRLTRNKEAKLVLYAISIDFRRIRSGLAALHWS